MNTFTGKQWKALIAHCKDKKKMDRTTNDNLRWPVLDQGHLIFTDTRCMVSVEVPIVTVHSADPEYVGGGLVRLDYDLWEDKILAKDTYIVTEDGLFKNGKQISEWRYINTATTKGFQQLMDRAHNNAAKMDSDELSFYWESHMFSYKMLQRMSDLAVAFGDNPRIIAVCEHIEYDPSKGDSFTNPRRFGLPTIYCEFALELAAQYAPMRR